MAKCIAFESPEGRETMFLPCTVKAHAPSVFCAWHKKYAAEIVLGLLSFQSADSDGLHEELRLIREEHKGLIQLLKEVRSS